MVSGSGISSNSLPNILLIVTDQLRFDAFNPQIMYHLSRVDSNTNTTTLFTNAFVSTPSCTPARAALLTGRSTWNHGMLGYDAGVSCENYTTTLPSVLADYLGYKTIVVGKNHFGTKEKEDQQQQQQHRHREFITHGYQNMKLYEGLTFDENINIEDDYNTFFNNTFPGIDPLSTCDLGWNDWNACPYKFDEHIHPTSWTTRQVLNIIDDNEHFLDYSDDNDVDNNNDPHQQQKKKKREQHPIFLKVSYHRPHSPYDPPKRLWDKHMKKKNELFYKRNINNDSMMNNSSWDQQYRNTTKMSHDAWHGDPGDDDLARTSRAAYMANVEFVDESIGIIVNKLRRKRRSTTSAKSSPSTTTLLDDMLIIWTSDHGDMNGDHNLWRKGYPYEASTHINMMMKMPTTNTNKNTTNAHAGGSKTKRTKTRISSLVSNKVSDAIVENRDIAATIYDYLGILANVTKVDPLMNGISLMNIIRGGKNNTVRNYLDLEHSTLYNDGRIHWNAIIGILPSNLTIILNNNTVNANDDDYERGNHHHHHRHKSNNIIYKYIFFPMNSTEQLFCISDDPNERYDLVVTSSNTSTTATDAAAHNNGDGGEERRRNKTDYYNDSILKFWRQTLVKQFQNEGRGEKWVTKDGSLVIGRKGIAHGSNYPCTTSHSHSRSHSSKISSSYSGNSTTLTAR